jgi:ubiquilin
LTERNPEFAQVLNNPQLLRETMRVMSNPALMREAMRNNDRAMSNIEALPGGFNVLRQLYENVQEPLMNAATGAGGDAANPLAGMLAAAGIGSGGNSGGAATAGAGTGGADSNANPGETQPLPNPWAAGAGSGEWLMGVGHSRGVWPSP